MLRWACWLVSVLLLTPFAFPQDVPAVPLTNDDIYVMLQLGFSEDLILHKIRNAPQTNFDTSMNALRVLKEVKATEKIIMLMINPKSGADQASSEPPPPPMPEDVGVFSVVKGKLVEIMPETVNWKSSGFLKSVVTAGYSSGQVIGNVRNAKSATTLVAPVEIIIRTIEGGSPADYQLFRFDVKDDRREFQAVMGAGAHAIGSKDVYKLDFQFEKIAPRIYRVKLRTLGRGEYGFLPPGVSTNSAVGRIHCFTVTE